MGVYRLVVSSKFDASHRLLGYSGSCSRLHGHTWRVEVCVSGGELDLLGMLVDFKVVKGILKKVIDVFDHKCLLSQNDPYVERIDKGDVVSFEGNPTAENLSRSIFKAFKRLIANEIGDKVKVEWVRVWESPDAYVEYSEEEG